MPAWPTVAIVTLLTLVSAAPAASQEASHTPVIGAIQIVSDEVFEEPSSGFPAFYRIANQVHVRTREQVIRRELLFAPGEPLNHERLEQTERNLRALAFLRDARVEAVPAEDGDGEAERVNIRVTTWDTWSLTPHVDFEHVDGRALWDLGVSENNLLGPGKSLTVAHRTDLDRTSDRIWYYDPQLAGSRFALNVSAADLSDGDEEFFALGRPYFSLEDPCGSSRARGHCC